MPLQRRQGPQPPAGHRGHTRGPQSAQRGKGGRGLEGGTKGQGGLGWEGVHRERHNEGTIEGQYTKQVHKATWGRLGDHVTGGAGRAGMQRGPEAVSAPGPKIECMETSQHSIYDLLSKVVRKKVLQSCKQ